jgi:hypothetical protein
VTAGLDILYCLGKVFKNLSVLAAYELYLVQRSHQLLFTAWKEIGVALGAEQILAHTAHKLRHLFYALRLIVAYA